MLVMAVSLDRTVGSATAEAHPGALAPVSNRLEQARPRDALQLWRPEQSTSLASITMYPSGVLLRCIPRPALSLATGSADACWLPLIKSLLMKIGSSSTATPGARRHRSLRCAAMAIGCSLGKGCLLAEKLTFMATHSKNGRGSRDLPHPLQVGPVFLLWQEDAGAALADALQGCQHALPVPNVEHR